MKKVNVKDILHAEAIKELRREVAMRERVFPDWIAKNKLDENTAARRIACIYKAIQIVEDDNKSKNGSQKSLF